MKGTHRERQKYALLPKHTSTQRFHSPVTTLEDMTSWWGALVMLSKTENTFLKTTIVQCRNWVMCPGVHTNLGKHHSPNGRKFLIRKLKRTVSELSFYPMDWGWPPWPLTVLSRSSWEGLNLGNEVFRGLATSSGRLGQLLWAWLQTMLILEEKRQVTWLKSQLTKALPSFVTLLVLFSLPSSVKWGEWPSLPYWLIVSTKWVNICRINTRRVLRTIPGICIICSLACYYHHYRLWP